MSSAASRPSSEFLIALAQCESVVGTETFDPRPTNLDRLVRAVRQASAAGAGLVMFGEMFLTGYRTDRWNHRWAVELDPDAPPDPSVATLAEIAGEFDIQILTGTASRYALRPGVVHDSSILVGAAGLTASYHKLHAAKLVAPTGESVNEFDFFTPGDQAPVWHTDFGVVGPQICYDSSFPELSRAQSLAGAELLLNVTASATGFETHWEHLRAARAFENSAWYVACSVVGEQNGDRYFGRSAVVDPFGRTIAEGADGVEDLVLATIDPAESARWRERMNTMAARRPDVYGDMTSTTTDGEIA